ncbi:hypothetical protein FRC09_005653, partial [Ceratobasidium sp. 395]
MSGFTCSLHLRNAAAHSISESSPGSPTLSLNCTRSDTGTSTRVSLKRVDFGIIELEDITGGAHGSGDINAHLELQDVGRETNIGIASLVVLEGPTSDGALTIGRDNELQLTNLITGGGGIDLLSSDEIIL